MSLGKKERNKGECEEWWHASIPLAHGLVRQPFSYPPHSEATARTWSEMRTFLSLQTGILFAWCRTSWWMELHSTSQQKDKHQPPKTFAVVMKFSWISRETKSTIQERTFPRWWGNKEVRMVESKAPARVSWQGGDLERPSVKMTSL